MHQFTNFRKSSYYLRKNLGSANAFNHLWENTTDFSSFYCQEVNPTVKLIKHYSYKKIRNIVVLNKRIEKTVLSKLFLKKFKKSQKNLGWYKIGYNTEIRSQTSPNSLFVNINIITNKTSSAETCNNFFCKKPSW